MASRLFFIRPKPETTFQDMEVYIVKAEEKEDVWEVLKKEDGQSQDEIEYLKERYCIVDLIDYMKQGSYSNVIWGCSHIKY